LSVLKSIPFGRHQQSIQVRCFVHQIFLRFFWSFHSLAVMIFFFFHFCAVKTSSCCCSHCIQPWSVRSVQSKSSRACSVTELVHHILDFQHSLGRGHMRHNCSFAWTYNPRHHSGFVLMSLYNAHRLFSFHVIVLHCSCLGTLTFYLLWGKWGV
jgi:hypothetical protein